MHLKKENISYNTQDFKYKEIKGYIYVYKFDHFREIHTLWKHWSQGNWETHAIQLLGQKKTQPKKKKIKISPFPKISR